MKKALFAVSALACALTGVVAVACDKNEQVSYKFDTLCTDVSVQDITVNKGDEFSLPTPPSRGKEWEFGGWYLSDSFTGSPVTSVVADMGTTYYAKWDRKYKINLELGGGSLVGADDLYLKAGESVATYLADYIPTRSGYQFGQWLNGSTALAVNYRMPAEALTLTARYKVGYRLDVYTQSLDYLLGESGAEEFEMQPVTLYEYATPNFTVDYTLQGFTEIVHAGDKVEGPIKDNPQTEDDNHFKIYFNRNQYTVKLNPNIDGTAQQEISAEYYFEQPVDLTESYGYFTNVGYVFEGWSESASGTNDYPIDYIDAVLYNKDAGDTSEVIVEREYLTKSDATLYAYWNKGYSDLFGGSDTIFLLNGASRDIYLFRGGKYFKGVYTQSSQSFIFRDKNDRRIFDGRIINEDTFCYSSASRDSITAQLYSYGSGLNENVRLDIDAYNGVSYSVTGEDQISRTAEGTFEIDPETNELIATFDSGEGEMVGQTIHFILATVNSRAVFVVRNDEEYERGAMQRIIVRDGSLGAFNLPYYSLTLDGYGNALYYNFNSPVQYVYYYDEEMQAYRLMNSQGQAQGYARLVNESGYQGYMFYTASLDDTFKNEDPENQDTLALDGMMYATYTSGTTVVRGAYSLSSSYFGGYILTFASGSTTYTFRLNMHLSGTLLEPVITYTFERKPNGYLEYYYYGGTDEDGEDVFNYPMLVFNDETESTQEGKGKATFYASVSGTLTKAAVGDYVYDAESGLYTMTLKEEDKVPGISYAGNRLDLSKISSLVFAVDGSTVSNRIYYTYSYKDLAQSETLNTKEYEPDVENYPDQKGMSLLIVGGIAILTQPNESASIVGSYRLREFNGTQITEITTDNGYIYLEIDEKNSKFFLYESAPYRAYLYREDGTRYRYETLTMNGKGGATYSFRDGSQTVEVEGKVAATGEVTAGSNPAPIYSFTATAAGSEAHNFRYILVTDSSNNVYFSKISDKEGTFRANEGVLVLDGTGFNATYSDTYGNTYSGMYRARSENVVYLYVNNEYLYFELTKGATENENTFRLLGSELGTYILMNNQIADGTVVELDGKGNAILSKIEENSAGDGESAEEEESTLKEIGRGTYVVADDGVITISYTLNADTPATPHSYIGRTGTFTAGNYVYLAFFIQYSSVANTYVNEADYSVIVLNDAGSATRYTQEGGRESGTYTLLTDKHNILYYVNSAGTFATIYEYDPVNGLITRVENNRLAYFNDSFASLMFTDYGFAIFNGTERYYYYKEATDVVIYRPARDGDDPSTVNKYGFVESTFVGGFLDEITYENVKYYINEGYALKFSRAADKATEFPAPGRDGLKLYLTNLEFLPTGTAEFAVNGTVTLKYTDKDTQQEKTEDYTCTVVRRAKAGTSGAATEYETYLMLGVYRFDIDLHYSQTASECTYEVNRMRFYIEADSYTHLYYVQMFTQMMGSAGAAMVPEFGTITIWQDYDVNGEEDETNGMRMSATFGEGMPIYDKNGDLIASFENQPCEMSSNGSSFTVRITHKDETYVGIFALNASSGVYAFQITAFYREQKLTSGNYEVTVGRVVVTESRSYAVGNLITLALTDKSGAEPAEITASDILRLNGVWHVITRERNETTERFENPVYYKVELTEHTSETVTQEGVVQPYDSAAVTKIETVETVYNADGTAFADIDTATNQVMVFVRGRSYYFVSETQYAPATDTTPAVYTVTTTSGAKYAITVTGEGENKTIAIEQLATEEETE